MAGDARSADRVQPVLDGRGLRVAVVCARFNDLITHRLLDGARRGLSGLGVADDDVTVAWVPGAFETPVAAKAFALSDRFDAVICLGAVIRGETSHYDFVAGQCAEGIQHAALDTGVPIAFGVLTTEDVDQALARSEPSGGHNVGTDCAATVVEMARLLEGVRTP
ncbi:6,7-dimethyl-8-ribityllumazine synthase [soil metagenome]